MGYAYKSEPGYILANPGIRILLDAAHQAWHLANDPPTVIIEVRIPEIIEIPIEDTLDDLIGFDDEIIGFVQDPISEIETGVIEVDTKLIGKIEDAIDDVENITESIFKNYEGVISRTTFNVLELIDLVQSGVLNLSDLPTVVVQSIITNIDFSLSFLQNNNLAAISSKLSGVLDTMLLTSTGIMDVVADGANGIIRTITDMINFALDKLEALILDPLARLLQAILDAIKEIPSRIADELLKTLLKQAPAGLPGP